MVFNKSKPSQNSQATESSGFIDFDQLEKTDDNDQKQLKIAGLFDKIAKNYDLLNSIISFFQDRRWRSKLINIIDKSYPPITSSTSPDIYLDLATGSGEVLFCANKTLHKKFTSFIGIDISPKMINTANNKYRSKKVKDSDSSAIEFFCGDVRKLTYQDNSIKCITISFGLRNIPENIEALKEFHRVLSKGKSLFVLEFFPPSNSILSFGFNCYFRYVLPIIGGLFGHYQEYSYLPKSVKGFYTIEDFRKLCIKLGFTIGSEYSYLFGGCRIIQLVKKNS